MKIKKTFILFGMIFLIIFQMGCAVAQINTKATEEKVLLSSLDQEQLLEILSKMGVDIPEELAGINIKELIAYIESEPDLLSVIDYVVADDFLEELRGAVKSYYGKK